jgi:hypothetical protein
MSDWAKSTSRWFRRLLGQTETGIVVGGEPTILSGAEAVLATEMLA